MQALQTYAIPLILTGLLMLCCLGAFIWAAQPPRQGREPLPLHPQGPKQHEEEYDGVFLRLYLDAGASPGRVRLAALLKTEWYYIDDQAATLLAGILERRRERRKEAGDPPRG